MKKNIRFLSDYYGYIIVTLIVLIVFIKNGVIFEPDSYSYINADIIRSIGYPSFIQLHKLFFGNFYIEALLVSQFILIISSAFFLVHCIQKTLNLGKWYSILLYIIVLIPAFFDTKTSNYVLSEALAYPLYLIVIGNFLIAILNKKHNNFYYAAIGLYLLLLVRGQFLFLVPVFLIGLLILNRKIEFKKKHILLAFITLCIPILVTATDILYHKVKHNHTTTTPWTGIQLATIPFFISNYEDYTVLKTKEQQDYFKLIYTSLEQKKLLFKQIPETIRPVDFFSKNYTLICNGTINKNGEEFFSSTLGESEKTILNNRISSSIAFPLIKQNFGKWFKMVQINFLNGFKSKLLFFIIIIPLISGILFLHKKEDNLAKFFILSTLMVMGNIAIVSLVEHLIQRYTFYNFWIIFAILLLLLQHTFTKNPNE